MVGRTSESVFDPNGLLLDRDDAFGEMVTILADQVLAAGAAVGQITTGGKYILSLAAAVDGSQAIAGILAEACDATGADKQAFVYYTGRFRQSKVVFGTGHTAAANRRTLAQKGIQIVAGQPA